MSFVETPILALISQYGVSSRKTRVSFENNPVVSLIDNGKSELGELTNLHGGWRHTRHFMN